MRPRKTKVIQATTALDNAAAFASEASPEATRGRGRPATLLEDTVQVTALIFKRQVSVLDRLALDIRDNTGATLDRSPLLRGIVDGVLDAGVPLDRCSSEADIRRAVADAIGGEK